MEAQGWRGWIGDALVFESSDDGQTTALGQVGHEFNGAFFPGSLGISYGACVTR